MLPDGLQHTLNGLKSNTLRGRFYKAKQEQRSDVRSSAAGVSAFGMPCSYFLQKTVLPLDFSFLLRFTTPLLTQSLVGIPPPHCTRTFAVVQTLPLPTGLPLWAHLWVMVVLSLACKVSVPSWPRSTHQAALALLCISNGHPLSLHLI